MVSQTLLVAHRYRQAEGWCNQLETRLCRQRDPGQIYPIYSERIGPHIHICVYAYRYIYPRQFCLTFPHFECGNQPDKPKRGCQGAVNSLLKRLLPAAYEDGELLKVFESHFLCIVMGDKSLAERKYSLLHSSGNNLPRGSKDTRSSSLPSARKVSWQLHHEGLFPAGEPLSDTLSSDPTCALEKRYGGCASCHEPKCRGRGIPKTCEFNQACPNDTTTAAKLGGNGALATHMVRKIFS